MGKRVDKSPGYLASENRHVPSTVSERLHFLAKQDLSQRSKIMVRGKDGKAKPRKVSMLRLLDWLACSALESRGFRVLDVIAQEERVSLRDAVRMLYDYGSVTHSGLRAFIRRNKKPIVIGEVIDETVKKLPPKSVNRRRV